MPRLPEVSGRRLAALLEKLGYELMRTRGSHRQYALVTECGRHVVTVPMHHRTAKGTLSDVLKRVALWTGRTVEDLTDQL